jgi:FdhE protein
MLVTPSRTGLAGRAREHADWQPWVAVLDAVRVEVENPAWTGTVPDEPGSDPRRPLLAGVTFTVSPRVVRRWLGRLLQTAGAAGGTAATLADNRRAEPEQLVAILEAGLTQDTARVTALAKALGFDAKALNAVAGVAPVPLARACAERWAARVPASWSPGWCPVCGSWATLAEARGLERARRLRCGRCASDWRTEWLACPFCGADDHAQLGALVLTEAPDGDAGIELARTATSIDTCHACRGYIKTVTTLTPTAPDDLALLDLATVELDVAALEHGYRRPVGPGSTLDARVTLPVRGRLGRWWRA